MTDNTEMIASAIERHESSMLAAERFLWKNPELGFREWKAHEYLTARFREMGLSVTEAGDIPGFYADIDTGRPGPTVCVLGEMDALPVPDHPECDKQTGAVHACGHNCQSASLIGVAGALSDERTLKGMCGKIRVMAVPAEELVDMDFRTGMRGKGVIKYPDGKTELLRRGFFDGVDMCFYVHTQPGEQHTRPDFHIDRRGTVGILFKRVLYTGETKGELPNALYAATTAISAINSLREKFGIRELFFTHTIITSGGKAVNVIPTEVVVENDVRAESVGTMKAANDQINRAFAAGALAVGAKARLVGLDTYLPHNPCEGLADLLASVAERHCDTYARNDRSSGGSDFANLSTIMPTIYGMIGGVEGRNHGSNFFVCRPDWAVVESARLQAEFVARLLAGEAEAFREATAGFKPLFPSKEALMTELDSLNPDLTCVEYADGSATVRWTARK